MRKNRVVITDIGIINSLGSNCDEIIQNIEDNQNKNKYWNEKYCIYVGKAKTDHLDNDNRTKKMDTFTLLAVEASKQLDLSKNNRDDIFTFMGSCLGGIEFAEREINVLYNHGPRRVSPYLAISMYYGSNVAQIAIYNGLHGQSSLFSDGSVSSASAICWAYEFIRNGLSHAVIAGGSECPTTELGVKAFNDLELFKDGNNFISDGSGLMLLENKGKVKKPGKSILCEILGYGEGYVCNEYNLEDSIRASIIDCLINSNLTANDIDVVVLNNDCIFKNNYYELKVIKGLFLKCDVLYLHMKQELGYSFGANFAQEMVVLIKCLINKKIPQKLIYTDDIEYRAPDFSKEVTCALLISIDIYGKCVSLAIKRDNA